MHNIKLNLNPQLQNLQMIADKALKVLSTLGQPEILDEGEILAYEGNGLLLEYGLQDSSLCISASDKLLDEPTGESQDDEPFVVFLATLEDIQIVNTATDAWVAALDELCRECDCAIAPNADLN